MYGWKFPSDAGKATEPLFSLTHFWQSCSRDQASCEAATLGSQRGRRFWFSGRKSSGSASGGGWGPRSAPGLPRGLGGVDVERRCVTDMNADLTQTRRA